MARTPVLPGGANVGPQSTHCCHSGAEPNAALGSDGAARRSSNLIGVGPSPEFRSRPLAETPPAPTVHRSRAAPGPWTSSSGQSEFQSSIQDLIRRFETSQGFCRFGALSGAVECRFAAGRHIAGAPAHLSASHIRWVGLDLMPAGFAPDDQPVLGRSGSPERHRRAALGLNLAFVLGKITHD
jgi:hypothetical protein